MCPQHLTGVPCAATGAAIGSVIGGGLGVLAAGGCAVGSGGICAAGAPAIVGGSGALGAGIGAWIGKRVDAMLSEGAKPVPSNEEIVDAVEKSGATVKPHPTRTGEGVTIRFPDGKTADIRVETHPLRKGGPPQLHGNVETWDRNGNRTGNKHILP